jgi:hypothetical protein
MVKKKEKEKKNVSFRAYPQAIVLILLPFINSFHQRRRRKREKGEDLPNHFSFIHLNLHFLGAVF